MPVTPDTSLGDIVAADPTTARLLEGFGLDYCCHGDQTLREACEAAALDVDEIAAQLASADRGTPAAWTELDLTELTDHIEATHHAYLHEELPLLDALAGKVASVHGDRHPELAEVRRLVVAVREDLEPHMLKEERILFPAIRRLAAGQRQFPFGSIANPVQMMRVEHDRTGELLGELHHLTAGYAVPADGCTSYRSLYERLEVLEHDTHLHIHKENHALFPAAIALYDAGAGTGGVAPSVPAG